MCIINRLLYGPPNTPHFPECPHVNKSECTRSATIALYAVDVVTLNIYTSEAFNITHYSTISVKHLTLLTIALHQ